MRNHWSIHTPLVAYTVGGHTSIVGKILVIFFSSFRLCLIFLGGMGLAGGGASGLRPITEEDGIAEWPIGIKGDDALNGYAGQALVLLWGHGALQGSHLISMKRC